MESPPKRGRPRREESLKVAWLRQSTFNRWKNLKKLFSNKEDRPYSNNDLASFLIELYNKCSVGCPHGCQVVDLLLQHADDFVPLPPLRQGTDEERMEICSENYDAAHTPSIK